MISFDNKNLDPSSKGYIGKLRSNFMATNFNLYDKGDNPTKKQKTNNPRELMATILYV